MWVDQGRVALGVAHMLYSPAATAASVIEIINSCVRHKAGTLIAVGYLSTVLTSQCFMTQ